MAPQPTKDDEFSFGLWTVRVTALAQPTLNQGESLTDQLADRSGFENYDVDKAGDRGYGFVRLNQLAMELLIGARS